MTVIRVTTDGTTWSDATLNDVPAASTNIHTMLSNTSGYTGMYAIGDASVVLEKRFGSNTFDNIPLQTWTTQTSNAGTNTVRDFAYNNGTWVAVADIGTIRTSTDNGVTWITRTSNTTDDIYGVDYGNGVWVCAGGSLTVGNIRTSTDTVTWTARTSNATVFLSPVVYGNGLWVIGGSGGIMRTSTDAITWSAATSNFGANLIRGLNYDNNLWVAVGYGGIIRTSTNGTTWNTVATSNFGTTNVFSVAYGNGIWVAGGDTGQMRSSTNGTTWTTVTSNFGTSTIRIISYNNGLWLAGGVGGVLRTSTDGVTWTTKDSTFGTTTVNAMIYGNGLWTIGGVSGQIRTASIQKNITSAAVVNNKIYTVSGNALYTTNNFYDYTQVSLATSVNKIINENNVGLIVANSGVVYKWNGSTWQQYLTGISDNFIDAGVSASSTYLVSGSSAIYHSTDLTTWTTVSSPAASVVNDILGN